MRDEYSKWDLVFYFRYSDEELYRKEWTDQPLPDLNKELIMLPGQGKFLFVPFQAIVDYQVNEIRIRVDPQ